MRASRLISILMLLQVRGRMSVGSLAEEVEASVRTVHRDIDQLSAAGVPVRTCRGRDGGVELLDGWQTHLTGLTAPEAQAILLAALPGPASQLGLGDAASSVRFKLLASLPQVLQEGAARIFERLHVDPVAWYQAPRPPDHLAAVAEAVWTSRRLSLRYESWRGVVDREVEPLGLVLKAGVWYLVAAAGGTPRNYRMSSIIGLGPPGSFFERPRNFDLAAYWSASAAGFERDIYRDQAVLRVAREALPRLREMSSAVGAAVDAATLVDGPRAVRVIIPIESVEHAAGQLLRLGTSVEVLEPASLRRRMGGIARDLAALYAGERAATTPA